ncbi:hypothetical protein BB558_007202 [Smittium angustum]|uniref:Uncharacterized protein n=1 Tax=Smittium angustum TaxID=133377 RepID=A0A2U1IVN7_SMIAN|nr:hypothetical protein BB558_007202 [Smittium angustum]
MKCFTLSLTGLFIANICIMKGTIGAIIRENLNTHLNADRNYEIENISKILLKREVASNSQEGITSIPVKVNSQFPATTTPEFKGEQTRDKINSYFKTYASTPTTRSLPEPERALPTTRTGFENEWVAPSHSGFKNEWVAPSHSGFENGQNRHKINSYFETYTFIPTTQSSPEPERALPTTRTGFENEWVAPSHSGFKNEWVAPSHSGFKNEWVAPSHSGFENEQTTSSHSGFENKWVAPSHSEFKNGQNRHKINSYFETYTFTPTTQSSPEPERALPTTRTGFKGEQTTPSHSGFKNEQNTPSYSELKREQATSRSELKDENVHTTRVWNIPTETFSFF